MDKLNKTFLHHQRINKFKAKVDNSLDKFRKIHIKIQNEAIKQRIKNKNIPSYDTALLTKFATSKEHKHFLSNDMNCFFKNDVDSTDITTKFIKKYSNSSKKIVFGEYKIDIHMVNNVMHKQKLPNAGFPAISIATTCKKKGNISYCQFAKIKCDDKESCQVMVNELNNSNVYVIDVDKKNNCITTLDINKNNKCSVLFNNNIYDCLPFWDNLKNISSLNFCTCIVDIDTVVACIEWGFDNNDKLIIPLAKQPVQNTNKAYMAHHQSVIDEYITPFPFLNADLT